MIRGSSNATFHQGPSHPKADLLTYRNRSGLRFPVPTALCHNTKFRQSASMWNVKGRRDCLYLDPLLPLVHSRDDSRFHSQNLLLQHCCKQNTDYSSGSGSVLEAASDLLATLQTSLCHPGAWPAATSLPCCVICFKFQVSFIWRHCGGRVVIALCLHWWQEKEANIDLAGYRPRKLPVLPAVSVVSFTLFTVTDFMPNTLKC